MTSLLIIGGGLAAATAAQTLREASFDGDITLVAGENHLPYQRPPLSKGYLTGSEGLDAVVLHPQQWYAEQNIRLVQGVKAQEMDAVAHTVTLADGIQLKYDAVLLATGASSRIIPLAGHELAGVHQLRSLGESNALAAALRDGGQRIVIIGAGWIGLEVAAAARGFGNDVTVLERDEVPLVAALGTQLGGVFRDLHVAQGVDLRCGVAVEGIVGDERAEGVRVDGEIIPADLVLIGVGAVPNTALAESAGLTVDNGIRVDAHLRASAPDVYAAGDVANADHPVIGLRLRSEHWANALGQGKTAALSMLGRDVVYDEIPYFYTDQYDLGMELSGYPPLMRDARVVIRGDVETREFIAFWVNGRRVVGGMNVNIWDVNEQVQALIRSEVAVDTARLADPDVPLASLIP